MLDNSENPYLDLLRNESRKHQGKGFLKYYGVAKRYMKLRYGITSHDMEILFYLYTEGIFNSQTFNQYRRMYTWNSMRIGYLVEKGYAVVFREHDKKKKTAKLYTLSKKTKHMINEFYDILLGNKEININPKKNKLFLKGASIPDKRAAELITKANVEIRMKLGYD